VLERHGRFALVEARLTTGARHQVRVHLAALGHPLAGDALYGGPPGPTARHFLHACRLELAHPGTGMPLVVESALPDDLRAWLASLE
jgi:23S rRNA pseudouridine1911/1915/1917 synthase